MKPRKTVAGSSEPRQEPRVPSPAPRRASAPFALSMFPWAHRATTTDTAEPSTWMSTLAAVEEDFKRLNQSTEADFLAIGGMLTDFLSAARRISSDISGMDEFISGEKGQAACLALEHILGHTRRMREDLAVKNEDLLRVRDSAKCIRGGFSSFEQTVSSFNMVAILARIETERLGSAESELAYLANEFRARTAEIVGHVSGVLDDVKTVEMRIGATVSSVSGLQSQQMKAIPSLIAGIETNLNAFRERQTRAVAAASALASQFDALCAAISEIVSAIQFHDITRQQLEHVAEVLHDLRQGDLRQGAEADMAHDSPSPAQTAVIRLQCAQMESAERLFTASTSNIDRQLETISSQIREMISAQHTLLDSRRGAGKSFLFEMQRRFEEIIDAIGNCELLEKNVAGAMAGLNEVMNRLNTSLAGIRGISTQVKYLAINARVSAIKLGAPGEPLNIIGETIQSLQASCETSCDETESGIAAVAASLMDIGQRETTEQRSGEEIRADVSLRTGELHASSQASTECWQRVSDCANLLRANIQSARDRLSAGQRVSQTLKKCGALLLPLAADSAQVAMAAGSQFRSEFERIAQRYTMQTEREVHQELTGIAMWKAADAEPRTAELAGVGGDFGENVDLF